MSAKIDSSEWMEVWNSNQELQMKVMTLQEKIEYLEQRLTVLEDTKDGNATISIYGKEVKRRE